MRVAKENWPKYWKPVVLDELCEINIGKTPSRSNSDYWGGTHTWVSIADMRSRFVTDSKESISDKALEDGQARLVKAGTLLMSFKLTIGKMAFAGKDLFTNEAIASLPVKNAYINRLDLEFLFWALQAVPIEGEADLAVKGRTLNKQKLARIEIPIPYPDDPTRSLAEQRRIVARIEALFAELRECRALNEKIQASTNRLVESLLVEIFPSVHKPMPCGWTLQQIKNIADKPQYGYTQSAKQEPVGPKFLRITDIQEGKVDWTSVPYCECDQNAFQKYRLIDKDIVFARSGATTGKTFLVKSPPQAVFASYLIRLKIRKALPEYVSWFFQSQDYWKQITPIGAAIPNMNAQVLQEIRIPVPDSESAQRLIVERCRQFQDEVSEMVRTQARDSIILDKVEQSILAQAFRGEL